MADVDNSLPGSDALTYSKAHPPPFKLTNKVLSYGLAERILLRHILLLAEFWAYAYYARIRLSPKLPSVC